MRERVFPDRERLIQLGVRDHERAQDADHVPVHAGLEQQKPALHGRIDHCLRRASAPAASSPDPRPARSRASHRGRAPRRWRETLLPGEHPRSHGLADRGGALVEALLLDHVQNGERRGLRDRVADIGAADGAVVGGVEDLGLAENARKRKAAGDRLRDGDQVGLDVVVLDREQLAGAGKTGLHLVGDEADPVLVADRAQPFHEIAAAPAGSRPRPAPARR